MLLHIMLLHTLKIASRKHKRDKISFEGGKEVIGVQTLESLGLNVDTSNNSSKPQDHGIAYLLSL